MRRLVGVAMVAAMLALPASGSAAQTVGLSFNPTSNCVSNARTYYGQKSTAPDPYVVPAAGVITSWTFRTAATGFPVFKFKVGTSITNRIVRTDAESEAVTLPANAAIPIPVRIPVVAGQRLGFYTDTAAPCYATGQSGVDDSLFNTSSPFDQTPGMTATYTTVGSWAFPLSARLEPDADGDGYGDETQDLCPTVAGPGPCPPPQAAPSGTTPTPDSTAPVLSPLSLSRSSFKAADGTKVTFVLSEAGTVVLTVERKSSGRRVSGKCKPPTSKNKTKKRCDRWVEVGSFSVAGNAGSNTFTLPSRIDGKALKPGTYRLTASATDPSKNVSLPSQKRFTIVK